MLQKILFVFLIFIELCVIFACNKSKQQQILGTWKGVKLENKNITYFFQQTQHLIDTLGKNHTDAENLAIYEVSNMDSLRKVFQAKHDSAFAVQIEKVHNTQFTFLNNKVAYLIFGVNFQIDTTKWNFDDEDNLVFEDRTVGSENAMKRMQVLLLNDTLLQLKLWQNDDTSLITFKHLSE